jgi:LmbE family N-acetylglucosaminyl deacetylase
VTVVLPRKLTKAMSAGDPIVFVSPHLDDAVLSCGALLETVAAACPVVVVTVFTTASEPPHTYAARNFLGNSDADTLFEARRREDLDVLAELRVRALHLGFPDALFRRRQVHGALRRVPELAHRYPTYRYDIARGRLARGDRPMVTEIGAALSAAAGDAGLVFCPVGVGRHVDHLIARGVGARFGERTVYFSDFPYDQSATADREFLSRHRLRPWKWNEGIAAKARLIKGYRSQVHGLFPDGVIPSSPETYYVAER